MTRLPFILADLAREIRSIAPNGPDFVLELPSGTFGPVRDEIAGHYGHGAKSDADQVVCGGVLIKRKVGE